MIKGSWILLIVSVLLSSGCAYTSQAVKLKPEIQPPSVSIGQDKPVLLTVVDERSRSTLGTRGGGSVGAEITVAGDLTGTIRNSLADGLQHQGFKPTSDKPTDGRELRVEIRNLDYRVTQGFWSGTLNTECGLKAICIIGSARPYEQLYRGEFEESIQFVQSAEANEKYINSAVSRAINLLLQDSRLSRCLAQ